MQYVFYAFAVIVVGVTAWAIFVIETDAHDHKKKGGAS